MLENKDQKKLRSETLSTQFVFCKPERSLPNKCPYIELSWSAFYRIQTK